MKLESLELDKFKENSLKKEQLFMLNGGGTETGGGTNYNGTHGGQPAAYDYSYDSIRERSDGSLWITFHGRSNITFAGDY